MQSGSVLMQGRMRIIALAGLIGVAAPALSDTAGPWRAVVWQSETGDDRLIPTNRWIWQEIGPGIFAPAADSAVRPGVADTSLDDPAAYADALTHLATILPSQREPGLWCLEWQTAIGAPRLACLE